MNGFEIQARPCATCIYRKDSPVNLAMLEAQVSDFRGGFVAPRICHHSADVCCRGFWNAHKDKFPMGRRAQRLGMVEFVDVDLLVDSGPITVCMGPENMKGEI